MEKEELIARLEELAPWHLDFEVAHGVRTSAGNARDYGTDDTDHRGVHLVDPWHLEPEIRRLFPGGVAGKTFLDVGCNGGGYCFLMKSLGAARTLGFDPREHWINQAEFVMKHWDGDRSGMEFKVARLEEVDLSPGFDLTLFKGVFYHLPDPIANLLTLCANTREAIIVNSASRSDIPEGALLSRWESTEEVMSGIDGLCWWPGGPLAVRNILRHAGFLHARTTFWNKQLEHTPENFGRFQIIAGREPIGFLANA